MHMFNHLYVDVKTMGKEEKTMNLGGSMMEQGQEWERWEGKRTQNPMARKWGMGGGPGRS